jgi:hypothetical protein
MALRLAATRGRGLLAAGFRTAYTTSEGEQPISASPALIPRPSHRDRQPSRRLQRAPSLPCSCRRCRCGTRQASAACTPIRVQSPCPPSFLACRAHAAPAGSAVAAAVKTVNESSGATLLASLREAKAKLTPYYPQPKATGLSFEARLALLGVISWTLYRIDKQSRAHEWIVDLSLDVLQAAWYMSFLSIIPFRAAFVAFRGMAPASAPLTGLRTAVILKP